MKLRTISRMLAGATALILVGLLVPQGASAAITTIAQDGFSRVVSNGWGSAEIGGGWTTSAVSSYFVDGGAGGFTHSSGTTRRADLNGISVADVDVSMQVSIDKPATGNGVYAGIVARKSGAEFYMVRARFVPDGSVALQLLRGSSTVVSNVTIPGLSYSPGAALRLRVSVAGASPTTIRAKAWLAGSSEPSSWGLSTTDSSSGLQDAGTIGVEGYLSSGATNAPITVRYDNVVASADSATPPPPSNVAPSASFTTSVSGLAVSANGTASSDSDGSIARWAWNFGDGATGSGATSSHSYASSGTYTVTLTVTDNDGATASTTRSVTVSSGSTTTPAGLVMAVIGDMPYGSSQLTMLPGRIDQMNADSQVNLAAHLGDISSPLNCSTSYFQTIKGQFDRFADPLVYTPGDNEWADCHRASTGAGDPIAKLSSVRSVFFPTPGRTLGKTKISVTAQGGYPENVRFNSGGITLGTIHTVGSYNDLATWSGQSGITAAQQSEFNARQSANVSWIKAIFAQAKSAGSRAVVIMTQADMFQPGTTPPSIYKTAFQAVVRELAAQSPSFAKPVLLINGDSHGYMSDKPLTSSTWKSYYGIANSVSNFSRITVKGGSSADEWLKLTVVSSSTVLQTQRIKFQ